jgi:DNA processing protein
VFVFPGRINDTKSEGCNFLIENNKAGLMTCSNDVLENMGWKKKKESSVNKTKRIIY